MKVVHTWKFLTFQLSSSSYTQLEQKAKSYLYCYLEAIETSRLWNLDFLAKTLDQVFIHNAIASSEESKNVLDEIPFIILSQERKYAY